MSAIKVRMFSPIPGQLRPDQIINLRREFSSEHKFKTEPIADLNPTMPSILEADGLSRVKSQSNTQESFSKDAQTTETVIEATLSDARQAD